MLSTIILRLLALLAGPAFVAGCAVVRFWARGMDR
jgi:hypothetical protein